MAIFIEKINSDEKKQLSVANYCIFMMEGKAEFLVDEVFYATENKSLLFLSPFQQFSLLKSDFKQFSALQFHGDFYCIEYHKKEVACNGLLFNNIFINPHFEISAEIFAEINAIFKKIETLTASKSNYCEMVMRSYLQLILALSSKEKQLLLDKESVFLTSDLAFDFQNLLNTHFLTERNSSFYAEKLHLSPDNFSKKIKKLFGKSPTQLIQERIVLEAKKQLHLTYKTIKEIAFEMNFQDEFYFSRFFKKAVGLSPKHFRETVGYSIVAEKSM